MCSWKNSSFPGHGFVNQGFLVDAEVFDQLLLLLDQRVDGRALLVEVLNDSVLLFNRGQTNAEIEKHGKPNRRDRRFCASFVYLHAKPVLHEIEKELRANVFEFVETIDALVNGHFP